jgi:hypothetical protein
LVPVILDSLRAAPEEFAARTAFEYRPPADDARSP